MAGVDVQARILPHILFELGTLWVKGALNLNENWICC